MRDYVLKSCIKFSHHVNDKNKYGRFCVLVRDYVMLDYMGIKLCVASFLVPRLYVPVLFTRAGGGGAAPVVRARWLLDIKSFHPEVKASKSVERFQRYSHFKITQF